MTETFVDRAQLTALLEAAHGSLGGEAGEVRKAALRFAAVVARRRGDVDLIGPLAYAARELERWDDDELPSELASRTITRVVRARAGLDPAIVALAADPRPDVRAAVVRGLVDFEPACRALLRQLAYDHDPRVRAAARARLGDEAEQLPWWAGLLLEPPGSRIDRASARRLRVLETRLRKYGRLRAADRAALARLPRAMVLEVLEGLLSAALGEPAEQREAVTAALETPGGLELLCRLLGPLSAEQLGPWRVVGAALGTVAPRRRTRVMLAVARHALESPRTPQPELSAWQQLDVPLLLAHWVRDRWPAAAPPRALLALLVEVPVAETHADVRAALGSALLRATDGRAAALGAELLRARSAGDQALIAQVGGDSVARQLADRAPPALRHTVCLADLDADQPEVRARALEALLDDDLYTDADVPRLRTAMERRLRELPLADLRPDQIAHAIPWLRPRLVAGELAEPEAAWLLHCIGARVGGGVWPPTQRQQPDRPLDVGAAPGTPIAPPTPEEWAAYRAARAVQWLDRGAGAHAWVGWGVVPAGPWTEDDWAVVEAVVQTAEARATRLSDYYAEAAADVLRLEASPRARALLLRLRDAGLGAPEDDALLGEPAPSAVGTRAADAW